MRQIKGKSALLRVNGEFELPRVRGIGVQLYTLQQNIVSDKSISKKAYFSDSYCQFCKCLPLWR